MAVFWYSGTKLRVPPQTVKRNRLTRTLSSLYRRIVCLANQNPPPANKFRSRHVAICRLASERLDRARAKFSIVCGTTRLCTNCPRRRHSISPASDRILR